MSDQPHTMTIEVRPAHAPDGSRMVLLQLEDGWALMPASGAREVANMLNDVADEIDPGGS